MKSTSLKIFAALALAGACLVAQAVGIDPMSFLSPELAMGISLAGAGLTTTYKQAGETLTLAPGAAVANGAGYMFGVSLFGVALAPVASGVPGPFLTEGVVEIGKTSALAIAVGDRVFWDATNSVVNKTTTSQTCIGVAVSAAANPSATVLVKLGSATAVAA